MKCNNCGSEWKIVGTYSQVKSCPFCGKKLIVPFIDEPTLDFPIKMIFDHFGYELLRDSKKFISVFSDIAPKMKSERKMIGVALEQGVGDLFVNTPASDREYAVRQAIRKLEIIMSENAIYTVISSLIIAMDWDIKLLELLPSSSSLEIDNETVEMNCDTETVKSTTSYKTHYNCLHPVKVAGKYGYADENNQVVIAPKYDRAKPFSFDRAKVFSKGKYGFIDRSGDEVIPLVYDQANDFKGNTTEVVLNGEGFIIDIDGRIIR